MSTVDAGWASADVPLASPPQYFEHVFSANAGSYHVWVRLRALNDSKYNDSIWVQFSDAVNASNKAISIASGRLPPSTSTWQPTRPRRVARMGLAGWSVLADAEHDGEVRDLRPAHAACASA